MESALSCQAEESEDILNMVESLRLSSDEPEKCLDRILKFLLVEQDGEYSFQILTANFISQTIKYVDN